MTAAQAVEAAKTVSFEEFWSGLEKTSAIVQEVARRQEETDRQMKKNAKEADRRREEMDRQMKENAKEAARRQEEIDRRREEMEKVIKENGKQLGELNNRFGQVVEHMVVPNLVDKFRELNFEFSKAGRNIKIKDRKHNIFTEVDAFLEDGDKVMAVETKVKPSVDDVAHHAERMEKLRRYANLRGDSRKYLGAIAGVVIEERVRECILKNGFYIAEPSGNTFNIIAPEGEYCPREW
jgi:hypothetical protein